MIVFCSSTVLGNDLKSSDIVGNIYSTDILTHVNGKIIDSYNVGGKTAICVEDLVEYGFNVVWQPESRKLVAGISNRLVLKSDDSIHNSSSISCTTVENIYKTDIITTVNGFEVPAYNIGGRTVVCIEDLGDIESQNNINQEYGYSKYGMISKWDEASRELSLETFKDNTYELKAISKQYNMIPSLEYNSDTDMMEMNFNYIDDENKSSFSTYSYSSNDKFINRINIFEKVYIDDTVVEIDEYTALIFVNEFGANMYFDIDKISELLEQFQNNKDAKSLGFENSQISIKKADNNNDDMDKTVKLN